MFCFAASLLRPMLQALMMRDVMYTAMQLEDAQRKARGVMIASACYALIESAQGTWCRDSVSMLCVDRVSARHVMS